MNLILRIIVLVALLIADKATFAQSFQVKTTNLPPLGRSASGWADVDNDGLPDVALIGVNSSNFKSSGLYKNNGDGSFTNLSIGLPDLSDGSISFFDLNNDDKIDLLITGSAGTTNERTTRIYKNKGNGLFEAISTGSIIGVAYSSSVCGDFNNDGKIDIFICGISTAGIRVTKVYKNNGNETFSEVTTSLEGISDGKLLLSDFNNDGYLDVLISGTNSNNRRVTDIYTNNKKGGFAKKISDLPALREGDLSVADFNNDGYTDLVVSGNDDNGNNLCKVYRNNSGVSFTFLQNLENVKNSAIASGDYDNDGLVDIIISGSDNTDYKTFLYKNSNGISFIKTNDTFTPVTNGSLDFIDYNNDSKIDILETGFSVTGPVTHLYVNQIATPNSAPQAPLNLTSISKHDSVVMTWNRNTDAETAAKGLHYGFYIGSSEKNGNIATSYSDVSSGIRKINKQAPNKDTFAIVKNLPEGKYYWSAQAVDGAHKGSSFATESSFTICHDFSIGNDTSICNRSTIILQAGDEDDNVKWFSSRSPGVFFSSARSVEVQITEKVKIWAELTKQPLGCTRSDTILIDVSTLPEVNIGRDTAICYLKKIMLRAGGETDRVDWYRFNEGVIFSNIQEINLTIIQNDTIICKVTNIGGCFNYDTLIIQSIPLPVVDLGEDRAICFNESITLNAENSDNFVSFFSANKGQIGSTNILSYKILEEDTLWVKVTNRQGCFSYDTLLVHVLPLPLADAGRDTLICKDEVAILGGNYSDKGLQFFWSPESSLDNPRIANPVSSVDTTTTYYLKVIDEKGCVNYDTVIVKIDNKGVISAGTSSSICFGESIKLGHNPTASGSSLPYNFSWSPEGSLNDPLSANPTAKPDTTTTYRLITKTRTCFVDTSYVTITVNPLPIIIKSNDVTIGYNEVTTLSASGGVSYFWYPSEGLSRDDIATPEASPVSTTNYYVRATDAKGCQSTESIKVYVKNEIFVPNLFTPNGDDNNDYFKVYGTGIKEIHFKVFNRLGVLVYQSDNIEEAFGKGWDGNYKGTPQETGPYKWVVYGKFFDDSPIKYKEKNNGTINLIR